VKPVGVQDIPSSKQANSSLFSVRKNSSGSDVDTDPFFDDQFFEKKNKLPLYETRIFLCNYSDCLFVGIPCIPCGYCGQMPE
jgi:hypothetical protein